MTSSSPDPLLALVLGAPRWLTEPLSLPLLAGLLGAASAGAAGFALARPAATVEALRRFPRSLPWGCALMLLSTVWFLWNVHTENLSDFAAFKPAMMVGFTAVGVGACFFLQDFLAVRGLAILAMLVAKVMVDSARWAASDWRLLIVWWAYALVAAGMWLTISPWRARDAIGWLTATPTRFRTGGAILGILGLLTVALAFTAFRG